MGGGTITYDYIAPKKDRSEYFKKRYQRDKNYLVAQQKQRRKTAKYGRELIPEIDFTNPTRHTPIIEK